MNLPLDIYATAAVRRIDRNAIDNAGVDAYTLMSRAGEAATVLARSLVPSARKWQVICGAGNNAGDAYVVARLARERGISISLTAVTDPARLKGDARRAFEDFLAAGGTPGDSTIDDDAELLIDGLLGSGLTRPVEGRFADAIDAMNAHPAPVLALDLPSGLDGDSGEIRGVTVRATATITFVGLKSGLFLRDGPEVSGTLHFSDLDIPPECRANVRPAMQRMHRGLIATALPRRQRETHKNAFGHVLIVGGGPGMPGAVKLCGAAALRAGAGLVSIATHPSHSGFVPLERPELMCHGVATPGELAPLLARATAIAVGPGLGTSAWARSLFTAVLESRRPVVADADALNLLADGGERPSDWILTPHPGEAGTLLGHSAASVQADRLDALARLLARFAGTVVLKGAGTLVSSGAGTPWLCTAGNPGMASPGTGDVLTGIIAAFLAQGLPSLQAATAGVFAHAAAGDAAAAGGERGLLASDLVDCIRAQVNH